jgi:hypothetical protein
MLRKDACGWKKIAMHRLRAGNTSSVHMHVDLAELIRKEQSLCINSEEIDRM